MKKLLTFLMFFLLATAMAQTQAATVTWTASAAGYSNTEEVGNVVVNDDITIKFSKGSNSSNAPKYYTSGTAVRAYGGNTIAVVSNNSKKITEITFTFGSSDGTNVITAGAGTFASPTWTGSRTDVTFTIGGTTGNRRIAAIKVTYEDGGVTPPTPTTYNVTVDNNITGGTVSASPTTAKENDEITLTATPATGYEFGSWNVTNASTSAPISVSNNKFTMPAANVNVSATFNEVQIGNSLILSKDTYAAWGASNYLSNGGSVSKSPITLSATGTNQNGPVRFNENSYIQIYQNTEVTFTAQTGYKITKIVYNCTTADNNTYGPGKIGLNSGQGGTYSYSGYNGTWAGKEQSVTFTASAQSRVNSITIEFESDDTPPSKTETTTTFGVEKVSKTVGDADFTHTAALEPSWAGSVSYSSTNEGVATVDAATGLVHIVAVGTTTIKAEFAGDDDYEASSDSYELTVTPPLTGITCEGTPDEFWKGDTFNHNGITVWAHYSDGESKDVTSSASFSYYGMDAGEQTVEVGYQGFTCTYTINVKTIANTQETAYTAAQAKAIIDAGKDLATSVYVKGTVNYIEKAFTEQDGNTSFKIEDDFMFYRNYKGADKERWTSDAEAPQVGDQVIGFGTLRKYIHNETVTYRFEEGNYIVSMIKKELSSIAISGTPTKTEYTVGEAFNPAGLTVTGTYSDGSKVEITEGITWSVSPETFSAAGDVTVTVAATVGELTAEAMTFTVTVTPEKLEAFINLATTEDISGDPTADVITWTKKGFVVTNEKRESQTAANNYYPGAQSRTSTRFYSGHVLTFTPADGKGITKIEYAATTTSYATTMANSTWTNASASADGTKVTITPADGTEAVVATIGGTTGGTSFTIYYEDATPVVRTLDHITISDYKTEFKQGDAFTFGGKVMASYEEDGVADRNVTSLATFSGYDMNVAGEQTVTVSYTENGVTKTATYDINVAEVFMIKVVVAQPTGGTFVVKNNATGEVVNSGDMLPEGTVLKAEATPAEGYAYNYWQVYTDHHTLTKYDGHQNETYKLDKNNIEEEARAVFSASFHKVGKIVYSWSANGNVTTDTYEAGEDVVAPANPANITIDGVEKVFTGWVTTSTVDASTAPEYVTNFGKAQSNKMYFAVYATATQGTGGTGDYYERIDQNDRRSYNANGWQEDWTEGEYIIVNETSDTKGYVFNGTADNDNKAATQATITVKEGKKVIESLPEGAATITLSTHMGTHLIAQINGEDLYLSGNNGKNGLAVRSHDEVMLVGNNSGGYAQLDIIYDNADAIWYYKLGGLYLMYRTGYAFRTYGTKSQYDDIYFYVKKAGVTYSDFTTGDAVKGEFKLVKSTMDLVAGREYIIVSKHAAGNYGLSIDAADSRQTTKYDDNGKELPSTGSKTNNDFRRAEQDVTLFNGDEYASINGKTSVLTLGGADGAWKFNSAAGYLAMNGDRACLNVTTAPADNAELTNIAIDANNKVVIKFNKYPGTETSYRYIFLNFNEGYPRFAAYGAGSTGWTHGKDIYLYYREADPTPVETLANIEANGINGTEYTIADELEVVYVNGASVWAKDNAKSYAYRENTYPGVVTYLSYDYDQNNWIELQMNTSDQVGQLAKGDLIKAGSVKGTYNGYKDRYHKMTGVTFEKEAEGSATYEPNTYTMASFWDDNVYDYVVSATGKEFFLMNPKIEEYCSVTDAVWDGSKFVVPAPGKENVMDEESNTTTNIFINSAELKGAATVDWSFNSGGNLDNNGLLQNDKRYKFLAIVTKGAPAPATSTGAPAKVAPMRDLTATYTIYPTDFVIDEKHIITEIEDVTGAKTVKGVRYFNVAGVEFGEAQPGLNIIVTEYSDGSHSAVKVIR